MALKHIVKSQLITKQQTSYSNQLLLSTTAGTAALLTSGSCLLFVSCLRLRDSNCHSNVTINSGVVSRKSGSYHEFQLCHSLLMLLLLLSKFKTNQYIRSLCSFLFLTISLHWKDLRHNSKVLQQYLCRRSYGIKTVEGQTESAKYFGQKQEIKQQI